MSRKPALHYSEKDLSEWNSANFSAYLADEHARILGIPYVTRSIAAERKLMKGMADQYGADVVKAFIDRFLKEYRPTPQYPGTTFFFAYTYVRERLLPQILSEQKRKEQVEANAVPVNGGMTSEEIENWL